MATPLNFTMTDMQDLADTYDAMKLKYELKLERKLKAVFNRIADDLVMVYTETGEIPSLEDFEQELEVILKKAYREVANYSSKHYERELQKQQDEGNNSAILLLLLLLRKDITRKIFVNINKNIRSVAPAQVGYILNTTKKVIVSEIDRAILQRQEGEVINNSTIIGRAIPRIKEKNATRAGLISEMEIGTGFALGTEVENLEFSVIVDDAKKNSKILANLSQEDFALFMLIEMEKTWITMLDPKVRDMHISAHGQKKPILRPFVVGGELLMEPKDTKLGASLGNVINCRCVSIGS